VYAHKNFSCKLLKAKPKSILKKNFNFELSTLVFYLDYQVNVRFKLK